MSLLELKAITPQMLNAAVELDRLCFGGLWTLEGYQRELDSPNSLLLGLFLEDKGTRGTRGPHKVGIRGEGDKGNSGPPQGGD